MFITFDNKNANLAKDNANFINTGEVNHIINLDCVKSIEYAEATMEDLVLARMTAAEIAEKCDNLKIVFYFTDNTEMSIFAEKEFIDMLLKELNVKNIDY